MQARYIALAVTAAFASAAAYADNSNVELYGQANVTVGSYDNGNDRISKVDDNLSRIGLKGSEKLDGGLTAYFQIESMVWLDDGGAAATAAGKSTGFATREGWVGLKGNFGDVGLGRGRTPHDLAGGNYYNDNGLIKTEIDYFSIDPVKSKFIYGPGNGQLADRFNNAVKYSTPNLNGLTATLMYGFGENKGSDFDPATANKQEETKLFGLGVNYKASGLNADFAYQQEKNLKGLDVKKTGYLLGASYTMAPVKVGVVYQNYENEAAGVKTKRDNINLNAAYTLDKITAYGGYTMVGERDVDGDKKKDNADVYVIGASYSLSKRTSTFAEYGKISIKEEDVWGKSRSAVSVGLKHSF